MDFQHAPNRRGGMSFNQLTNAKTLRESRLVIIFFTLRIWGDCRVCIWLLYHLTAEDMVYGYKKN
jgi:hypothetical protein